MFGTWDFYGIMFAVLEALLLCTLYRGYFFSFYDFFFYREIVKKDDGRFKIY